MVTAVAAESVQISDIDNGVLIRDRRDLLRYKWPWEDFPTSTTTTQKTTTTTKKIKTRTCPDGTMYNEKRDTCVLPEIICPKNSVPDFDLGICVLIPKD